MFRRKTIGHSVIRNETSKDILAIINKTDLLLFILRIYGNLDSVNLLSTEIQKLKIARPFESIKMVFMDQTLYECLFTLKKEKVKFISCPFCQWWIE
jgi:hypothetical protein